MPHAIPQTHSAFCPHRFKGSLKSPNVTANVWGMEVEVGGIQTLSPYRWQFSFSKVWMLSINTSLASLLKRDLKKEITIDLILIEDSRGKKTQGLDDLVLTLHTYKGEYILTWQLTHLLCRLNFRSRWWRWITRTSRSSWLVGCRLHTNLVPRILSYPPKGGREGKRLWEREPGNEVGCICLISQFLHIIIKLLHYWMYQEP